MLKRWVALAAGFALAMTMGCSVVSSGSGDSDNSGNSVVAEGGGGLPANIQPLAAEKWALNKFKGKKVYYASLGKGWPLEDQWRNVFQELFTQLGMEYKQNAADIDPQKLAQNVQVLLNQKPDVLIVHAADVTNINNLIKQAHEQGIYVLNLNLMTSQSVDGYVGGNFNEGEGALAKAMVSDCKQRGKTKVAIVRGLAGDGLSQIAGDAYLREFKKGGMQVVADQPQSYDATKAHDMADTVMQQHPDLCGFIGTWDGMMVGAAQAVKQAGKAGKVVVYTSDSSISACAALKDGSMTMALDYGVAVMGQMVTSMVQYFLESGVKPGSTRAVTFPRYRLLDKAAAQKPSACYDGIPW